MKLTVELKENSYPIYIENGILKHADVSLDNMPEFVDRLKKISKECGIEFYVSISGTKEDLKDVSPEDVSYLN